MRTVHRPRSIHLSPSARTIATLLPAVALALAACAPRVEPRTIPVGMYVLSINGKAVHVPVANNLAEALRRTPSAASLMGELSTSPVPPLYIVDGAPVLDGPAALQKTPVCDAESVELLRPTRAVALYGEGAGAGAVVIRTRRGATPGVWC